MTGCGGNRRRLVAGHEVQGLVELLRPGGIGADQNSERQTETEDLRGAIARQFDGDGRLERAHASSLKICSNIAGAAVRKRAPPAAGS